MNSIIQYFDDPFWFVLFFTTGMLISLMTSTHFLFYGWRSTPDDRIDTKILRWLLIAGLLTGILMLLFGTYLAYYTAHSRG